MTADNTRLEVMVERLRRQGHRISPQRLEILRELAGSPDHPSAEALHRRLLARFPAMSLATVYKTIAALKQCGEILELQFSDRDNRYDAIRPMPHPHCICLECGAVTDPPAPDMERFVASLVASSGYAISSHRLDFFGLCPRCRKNRGI